MTALKRWAAWPLNAALVATLVACASAPPAVLLTLPSASSDGASKAAVPLAPVSTGTPRVLAVSPPEIPEYLIVRRVRYRAGASTLGEWPNTFWAERIEVGVGREFNAALRERLPGWRLCEANCSGQSPAASLQVTMVRLDYLRSERRLQATVGVVLWSTDGVRRVLYDRQFDEEIPADADTPQAQAVAIAELLRRVASLAASAVAARA